MKYNVVCITVILALLVLVSVITSNRPHDNAEVLPKSDSSTSTVIQAFRQ